MAKEKLPLFVAVLGIIYLLIAILLIAAGAISCAMANSCDLYNMGLSEDVIRQIEDLLRESGMSFANLITTFGVTYIVLGCIYGIASAGFFKGWWFMWYLGVILNALTMILAIVGLCKIVDATGIIQVVISLILLLYLFKPNVKKYFLNR